MVLLGVELSDGAVIASEDASSVLCCVSDVVVVAVVSVLDETDSLEIMPLVVESLSRSVLACVVVVATSVLSNVVGGDAIFVVGVVNWLALVVVVCVVGISVFIIVRLSQFITVISTEQLDLHFSLTPLTTAPFSLSSESDS